MLKSEPRRIIIQIKDKSAIENVLPISPAGIGDKPYKCSRLHSLDDATLGYFEIPQNIEERTAQTISTNFENAYVAMSEEEKCLQRTFLVDIPDGVDLDQIVQEISATKEVDYVQADRLNELYEIPNDPKFNKLWGIQKIECENAWDVTKGEGIIVAVLDTGVDYNHPDLAANMWTDPNGKFGFDFSDGDDNPMDYHGHGTHVAGTIAAVGNNEIGVIGVAPRAKIMAIKIFPRAFDSEIARALMWAVDNGARVLNNSWGPIGRSPSNPVIETAINYVNSKGGICVFAAGNNNDDTQFYSPANMSTVITVGATKKNDKKAGFSNWGSPVDVSAPGVDILSLKYKTMNYKSNRGTSMACPHVSGLVALYLEKNPEATRQEVQQAIENGSDLIGTKKSLGKGRINAARTVGKSGPFDSSISATSMEEGRLDIFWKGISADLQHQWWSPGWLGTESLKGTLTSPPHAVSREAGRLDVFAKGNHQKLQHRSWTGNGWSKWKSLGGQILSQPCAVSWGENRIDVFAKGTDNALWHIWWDGNKWRKWESLGGFIISKPVAVSWGKNRLDIFACGRDNALWHIWWDGNKWGSWESLGGVLTSPPEVVSWGPNRLDIFAKGKDNALWHIWWGGRGWGEWESLDGILASNPSVCSWGQDRLDIFAIGADKALWHLWWDGLSWGKWESLGGTLGSAPKSVSWGPNRIDVFALGGNKSSVMHRWWDGRTWGGWENTSGIG